MLCEINLLRNIYIVVLCYCIKLAPVNDVIIFILYVLFGTLYHESLTCVAYSHDFYSFLSLSDFGDDNILVAYSAWEILKCQNKMKQK